MKIDFQARVYLFSAPMDADRIYLPKKILDKRNLFAQENT